MAYLYWCYCSSCVLRTVSLTASLRSRDQATAPTTDKTVRRMAAETRPSTDRYWILLMARLQPNLTL